MSFESQIFISRASFTAAVIKTILIITLIAAAIFLVSASAGAEKISDNNKIYIEAAALNNKLQQENKIKIIDLRSSFKYLLGHLPGAVHLAEDEMRAQKSWVEELIPEANYFNYILAEKGINQNSEIVIYGQKNSPRPARLWFIFKYYDYHNLKILKGGYQSWQKNNFETKMLPFKAEKGNFIIKDVNNELLVNSDTIAENLSNKSFIVLDLRSRAEFEGEKTAASAPRKGRIPNSINLEWSELFDQQQNLKNRAELKNIFEEKLINPAQKTIVLLSNKGIRAAHLYLILKTLNYKNLKLYDGGWLAWSSRSDLPLEKN